MHAALRDLCLAAGDAHAEELPDQVARGQRVLAALPRLLETGRTDDAVVLVAARLLAGGGRLKDVATAAIDQVLADAPEVDPEASAKCPKCGKLFGLLASEVSAIACEDDGDEHLVSLHDGSVYER